MPTSEIISIGTELLLGETLDTNAQVLARAMREVGIDLYRMTIVGDNPGRIANVIKESLDRSQVVITTGGLGPTLDDPTREAAAVALGLETVYHPRLWKVIQERFARYGRTPRENNKRQAYLPEGARVLPNRLGTAPAFVVEKGSRSLIALPGVPEEMKALLEESVLPYLVKAYSLDEIILIKKVKTTGIGESEIDHLISRYERMANPSVGLAAKDDGVEIRITAKADSRHGAEQMIADLAHELRALLGEWIVEG